MKRCTYCDRPEWQCAKTGAAQCDRVFRLRQDIIAWALAMRAMAGRSGGPDGR